MSQKNKEQKQKLQHLQQILQKIQKDIAQAQRLVSEMLLPTEIETFVKPAKDAGDHYNMVIQDNKVSEAEPFRVEKYPSAEEIIEGVFNGFQMIGPDGQEYQIPENYASKSKLVEGDLLKFTITQQGRFLYTAKPLFWSRVLLARFAYKQTVRRD